LITKHYTIIIVLVHNHQSNKSVDTALTVVWVPQVAYCIKLSLQL